MGSTLASGSTGSIRHRGSFWQLLTEATPVAPPSYQNLAMQTQYNMLGLHIFRQTFYSSYPATNIYCLSDCIAIHNRQDCVVGTGLVVWFWVGFSGWAGGGTSTMLLIIIEQFGLEGMFRGHLVQLPCSEQGHLQSHQVSQSPIQADLECFQGWGIYHLSGQPVPTFHHPLCEKLLPYIQSERTLS